MKFFLHFLTVTLLFVPVMVFAQPSPGDVVPTGGATVENFVPITGLPVFEGVENTGEVDVANFFNRLYVLAVGAAAIVAVAQIMLAGFSLAYAGGNHSAIQEARNKIQNSILGLLLILSPTIVFGIINPDILNLRIDTGLISDRKEVAEVTGDGAGLTPSVQTVRVNLPSNGWGAFDDQCEFKASGFSVPRQLEIKAFGKDSVARGRSCCAAVSGELGISMSQSGKESEVCMLDTLTEKGRYVAHIRGQAIYEWEDSGGLPMELPMDFHIYTSGSGGALGDVDTIALHGYRDLKSAEGCQTFVDKVKNPDTGLAFLLNAYRGPSVFDFSQGLRVGLLEGKYSIPGLGGDGNNLVRGKVIKFVEIREAKCEHVSYGRIGS